MSERKTIAERLIKESSRDSLGSLLGEVPEEVEIPFTLWCEVVRVLDKELYAAKVKPFLDALAKGMKPRNYLGEAEQELRTQGKIP